jgi:predicted nucleotidyltransferase
MCSIESILSVAKEIAETFKPDRITLFGSYAYGSPTADSDVDLLVVLPFEGKSVYKSLEILNKVKPAFPVDLVVRTPAQLEERLRMNDFFMREIVERGKVLYAAHH